MIAVDFILLNRCLISKTLEVNFGELGMVGIVFLSSFYCYYIHCSRMSITHIKPRTLFVVEKYR